MTQVSLRCSETQYKHRKYPRTHASLGPAPPYPRPPSRRPESDRRTGPQQPFRSGPSPMRRAGGAGWRSAGSWGRDSCIRPPRYFSVFGRRCLVLWSPCTGRPGYRVRVLEPLVTLGDCRRRPEKIYRIAGRCSSRDRCPVPAVADAAESTCVRMHQFMSTSGWGKRTLDQ